jgi:hypothetical protein
VPLLLSGPAVSKIVTWGTALWLAHDVHNAFTEADAEAVALELPGGTAGECVQQWGSSELPALSESSREYHALQIESFHLRADMSLATDPVALAAAHATIDKAAELIATGQSPDGAPVTLCDVQAASLIIERQIEKSAPHTSAPCIGCAPEWRKPDHTRPPGSSAGGPRRMALWLPWAAAAAGVALSAWLLWSLDLRGTR